VVQDSKSCSRVDSRISQPNKSGWVLSCVWGSKKTCCHHEVRLLRVSSFQPGS